MTNNDVAWRNLYLSYDKILSKILRQSHVCSVVENDSVLVKCTENRKRTILDSYYKKAGVVLKGSDEQHGYSAS